MLLLHRISPDSPTHAKMSISTAYIYACCYFFHKNETIELRPHRQISKKATIDCGWLHGANNKHITIICCIIFEYKMVNQLIRWNLFDVKHN